MNSDDASNRDAMTIEETSQSPRFTQWVAFLMCSLIVMGSCMEASEYSADKTVVANQKWALSCSVITFILTMGICAMHMSPITSIFIINTKVEGGLIFVLVAFWSATVAIVSDAENGLAVNEDGAVSFGNLYYFSWAGFVICITLMASFLRSVYQIDVAGEIKSRSARLTLWASAMATCLVVMGSSANVFDNTCAVEGEPEAFCGRTKLGVALGCIGTIIALCICGMKIATTKAPFLLEAGGSLVLVIGYSFGVAFITGEKGPGAPLGNLYYSTWASLIILFLIGSSCFEDYQLAKAMNQQPNGTNGQEMYQHGRIPNIDVQADDPKRNQHYDP